MATTEPLTPIHAVRNTVNCLIQADNLGGFP
jgi:hypothetical protein